MREFIKKVINWLAHYAERERVDTKRYNEEIIKLLEAKITLAKQEAEVRWLREWTPNNPKPPRRVPHLTLWIDFDVNNWPERLELTANYDTLYVLDKEKDKGVNLTAIWRHFEKKGWTCWQGSGLEPKYGHAYRISAPLP